MTIIVASLFVLFLFIFISKVKAPTSIPVKTLLFVKS